MNSLSYREFSQKIHAENLSQKRFIKAQYEITYACNLRCVHCYTDPYNRRDLIQKELPYISAVEVLDKLYEENILWLCFTGGEIFMRKDFLKIYDYAHEKGFLITLFTNATLISEEIADHLAARKPFCVEISIYGATAETYERVTGVKGSFARFQDGVARLAARRLPLKFKTSLLNINTHEREGMKAFAENLGASLNMSPLIYPRLNGDVSSTRYRLSAAEILELTFESADEIEGTCAEITAADPRMYRCGCGKLNAHIDPYGKIGTCTWARKNRFDYKDAGVQSGMQNLAGIISAQYYDKDSSCHSCTAVRFCNKSPEMGAHETGDAQKPVEHFCEVAFKTAERLK